jgi:hypothetical protein
MAITTALTPRAVFRLALRQTEGLIASILRLLGLDLAAPDHSTLSRRGQTLRPRRAANRYTCWWTAQGSSSAVPVNGSSRSMPQGRVGRGERIFEPFEPERKKLEIRRRFRGKGRRRLEACH